MVKKILLFLVLNFAALAIGGLFTGDGVTSEWYQNLNKAPWTPPGWVFGMAWTLIMICFAFYMAKAYEQTDNQKKILSLFAVQWVLNVSWNPVFFFYHELTFGLILILLLTGLVIYMLYSWREALQWYTLLIVPYGLWLIIATSLNAYIFLYN